VRLPARPTAITAPDVSTFATATAETAARVKERVTGAAGRAADEACELLDQLGATAAAPQTGMDGFPPVALASTGELLTTAALDPIVAAHASACDAGRRYRAEGVGWTG
jgi:hypothetical protein